MADLDKELLQLGAVPAEHDDELAALGAISAEDESALIDYMSTPRTTPIEGAVAGLAAAPTEGVASRLGGAIGAGLEAAAGSSEKSLPELYEEYKQYNQQRLEKAAAEQPATYIAGQMAGGLALPWSKLIGTSKLAPGASTVEKMAEGLHTGAKMGAVIGGANAPDYTNLPEVVEQAGKGMAMGAPLGAGTVGAVELASGLARGAGGVARSIAGPLSERFKQGQETFRAGEQSLATHEGLETAKSNASTPVKGLINSLERTLRDAIRAKGVAVESAEETYGQLSEPVVNQFYSEAIDQIQTELEKTKDQATVDELMDLLDKFTTAREGRLQPTTQRIYAPGKKPAPVRSGPQARNAEILAPEEEISVTPGEVVPEVGQEIPSVPRLGQTAGGNLPAVRPPGSMVPSAEEIADQQAIGIESPSGPTPSDFGGYKKVMAATVDKTDANAIKAFHQRIKEREAEEAVLPGATDTEPIEVVAQEIDGYPDKVRLIARRKIVQEAPDEFVEQASQLKEQQKQEANRLKEAARQQALLDKVNQESQDETMRQLAADTERPYFEDVTTMTRPGEQNIFSPANMAGLQESIADVTPRFGDQGYQKTPSGRLATRFATQARDILTSHSPEIEQANAKINATKNIFESLGLDADKLIKGGGEGQKEFSRDLNKFFDLFKPETNTPQSLVDSILTPEKIDYIVGELNRIDPALAERFTQTANKQQALLELLRDFQKPFSGWFLHPIQTVRSFGGKMAYQAGYALERETAGAQRLVQPLAETAKKVFVRYAPEALQRGAQKAAQDPSPQAQQFSRILSNLATADDRTKNSMLFVMEQNAGYRTMLDKYVPKEKEETPEAKNIELEKFK